MPPKSPHVTGYQPDVLHRIVDLLRDAGRRGGQPIVIKDAPRGCRYRLEAPRPDATLVAYAASLGIDESGGNELGIQFAEKVTIRCE